MTIEQAMINYLSNVVGTLVGIMADKKLLTIEMGTELINIIGSGVDEITNKFKLEKSTLDSET